MNETGPQRLKQDKLICKVCHSCGHCNEAHTEMQRCEKCSKAFLPLNYFQKVHRKNDKFQELFADSDELEEVDLIKGLYVLW